MTPRERFLAAVRGKTVDRPPVWFMRQAGRYLPEYRALRERHSFEESCATPQIAKEITLQPVRRFGLDAAILFSDILVPLAGMGRPARFPGEGGPRIERPVRSAADVAELRVPDPAIATPFVADAIRLVRAELPDVAVLGFAAAPFTLASYLVEGGAPDPFASVKRLAYREPDAWERLLDVCADTLAAHLAAQLDAGADAVQVFDTWAEALAPDEFAAWEAPRIARIVKALAGRGKPVILFARGTSHLLPHLAGLGADVLSVDWRVDLRDVRRAVGPRVALQGNLDPTRLLAAPSRVAAETRRVLDAGRDAGGGHVFNLGHGILPGTPVESVEAMVETVKAYER